MATRRIERILTEKGQVTVPAEVRRALGASPGDKVVFVVDGNDVRLLPVTFTLETAFGSVEPLERPEDFDEVTRRAREEHARQLARSASQES